MERCAFVVHGLIAVILAIPTGGDSWQLDQKCTTKGVKGSHGGSVWAEQGLSRVTCAPPCEIGGEGCFFTFVGRANAIFTDQCDEYSVTPLKERGF